MENPNVQPHRHDDPNRTTPMGMIRYGHEFLDASFVIYKKAAKADRTLIMPPVPAMFLLGHGLELTFKAFLLSKQVEHRHLRLKLGHDLIKALESSKTHGLEAIFEWHPIEESTLSLLNALYSAKEFEYIVTGAKTIPHFPILQNFAVRLFASVANPIGFRARLDGWRLHSGIPPVV